tara:strand:- start:27 stop:464 length:438 start_codon:yes stop_codon:yes gene_type:complete
MSDRDWYTSQGVQFQNQPAVHTEQPVQNFADTSTSTKQQVVASEQNRFGQRTLAGLTIIMVTLSLQLFFLLISALPTSGGNATTVEDFETAMKVQLWFSILTVTAQLIGVKMIYNDTRDLSDFLDNDVEIRNNNLNIMAGMINRK